MNELSVISQILAEGSVLVVERANSKEYYLQHKGELYVSSDNCIFHKVSRPFSVLSQIGDRIGAYAGATFYARSPNDVGKRYRGINFT